MTGSHSGNDHLFDPGYPSPSAQITTTTPICDEYCIKHTSCHGELFLRYLLPYSHSRYFLYFSVSWAKICTLRVKSKREEARNCRTDESSKDKQH